MPVVLDEDDVRRTLVRIAHEIVESSGEAVALVGIHGRGAHLATRLTTRTTSAGRSYASRTRSSRRTPASPWRWSASTAAARTSPAGCTGWCATCSTPRSRSATSTSPSTATTSPPAPADPAVHASHLPFRLEDYTVVLVDDVLYTGRTARAGIEALFDYGRPARVQLAVLADRGHRELPIRPDYVGKNLPTARGERVNVRVTELDGIDEVAIVTLEEALA